jgi:hypothetical protein
MIGFCYENDELSVSVTTEKYLSAAVGVPCMRELGH